jgi:hypothetical protein
VYGKAPAKALAKTAAACPLSPSKAYKSANSSLKVAFSEIAVTNSKVGTGVGVGVGSGVGLGVVIPHVTDSVKVLSLLAVLAVALRSLLSFSTSTNTSVTPCPTSATIREARLV